MKCPNDQTEMEKGQLGGSGNLWTGKIVSTRAVKFLSMAPSQPFVFAWRCSKCGRVELVTEVDK